ncbi:MAG: homoserine O-succinyltransferase [Thaumarchaeota archaeon]|nr:homoserine O-succinyltransferase [Nitrososphaerota archaeon]MCL5317973.1 homoserine O-succinyltransferase [Nitrososphaerota archaeon]
MPKKTLLVNNYLRNSTRINRLNKEITRITGREPQIIRITDALRVNSDEFDAVILSGGDAPLNQPEVVADYREATTWLSHIQRPILGICLGHQLLGLAHGGRIARIAERFEGFYEVEVIEQDELLTGLPNRIRVYKSNIRVVARLMPGFKLLARSSEYEVEAFKHQKQPVFGVQFHPENYTDTDRDGLKILENFFHTLR